MTGRSGTVALVTGGSSGIGRATARRFVHDGARVVITGRRRRELAAVVDELGPAATGVQGDTADLDDLDRLVAEIHRSYGGLDAVVVCAGHLEVTGPADVTPEQFDRTFAVNARGPFFLLQKVRPLLRPGAAVVLVTSATQSVGIPGYATYAASKAALRSLTRSWAAELAGERIRVNALSPGPVDTAAVERQAGSPAGADRARAAMAADNPLGRLATPEEIAGAAVFLTSADAGFITGAELVADGGATQL